MIRLGCYPWEYTDSTQFFLGAAVQGHGIPFCLYSSWLKRAAKQSGQPWTLHAAFWSMTIVHSAYTVLTSDLESRFWMLAAWLYGACTYSLVQLHISSAHWVLPVAPGLICCHGLKPPCVVSPSGPRGLHHECAVISTSALHLSSALS